jgi:hypothetical protein
LLAKDRRQLGPTILICSRAQARSIPQPKIAPISLAELVTELKSCTVTVRTFSRCFFVFVYAFHIATRVIFQGTGAMQSSSVSHEQYSGVSGERVVATKPTDSNVLKGNGAFDETTQHRLDYVGGVGDRAVATRPVDSDLLKGTGAFDYTTQNRADFTGGAGERYETVRRGASDVLKVRLLSFHSTVM